MGNHAAGVRHHGVFPQFGRKKRLEMDAHLGFLVVCRFVFSTATAAGPLHKAASGKFLWLPQLFRMMIAAPSAGSNTGEVSN